MNKLSARDKDKGQKHGGSKLAIASIFSARPSLLKRQLLKSLLKLGVKCKRLRILKDKICE